MAELKKKGKYQWREKDFYIERETFLSPKEAIKEMEKDYYYKESGKEADFEEKIMDCIIDLCYGLGLPVPDRILRQKIYKIDGFTIKPDIIVIHQDNSLTVFEIKKANEKHPCTATSNQMNGIGQLLLYKSVLSSIYSNAKIRLALVDNKIHKRTFFAFAQEKLPITLVEVQKERVFVPYYAWGDEFGK